jgi:response regulator NasT
MQKEDTKSYSVILADDEPVIRMHLSEMLMRCGYHVTATAQEGMEAIELCRKHHPDIVFLDVRMQVLDGLAAANYILQQDLADTIIMLTAYHDTALVEKASEIGVSGYLVKPVNEEQILPCIRVALKRSQEIRRLRQEVKSAKNMLETRKLVERAKSMLMETRNLSDKDAYDYIRSLSKAKNVSMRKVSEILLQSASLNYVSE